LLLALPSHGRSPRVRSAVCSHEGDAVMESWIDTGSIDELSSTPLKRITVMNREFAVSYKDGTFGVLSNTCNHAGEPLGKGRLDGEYIVCPWHNWKFHRCSGKGEPGSEDDRVPAYPVKVEGGHVLIDLNYLPNNSSAAAGPRDTPMITSTG
jgi:nitrite reductase/ring-hydroxylating ferredoxin subunit